MKQGTTSGDIISGARGTRCPAVRAIHAFPFRSAGRPAVGRRHPSTGGARVSNRVSRSQPCR